MPFKTRISLCLLPLTVAACTAGPVSYTDLPMTRYDPDTTYAVENSAQGFTLTIEYARYQFVPESRPVLSACKQALTALAYDLAEQRGRKILPINEQRIRTSFGRNAFGGMTLCSATVPVQWDESAVK